jgi:hypothetical protein
LFPREIPGNCLRRFGPPSVANTRVEEGSFNLTATASTNLTVSQPTPLLYPLHPSKSKTPPHNHGSTSRSGTSRRHIYRSALCPSLTDHLPFHPSPRAARSRDRRREREKRNPVLGRKERREEVGKREERINKVGRSLQKEIGEREKSLGRCRRCRCRWPSCLSQAARRPT